MMTSKNPYEIQTEINRGLQWSLGFHIGLAIFIVLKALVFPSETKPYVPTLRVDIVGLPDLLKKDLPKQVRPPSGKDQKTETAPTVKKPTPKPQPDQMAIRKKKIQVKKKRKKKILSALDRIKALDKIKQEEAPIAPIKGNILSSGSSLSGDAKEIGTGAYYDLVVSKIRENWTLPIWVSRQKLSAQVEIYIHSSGRLQGMRFRKYSGSAPFDDAVRAAVARSQPFARPPKEIQGDVLDDGILLGFPL